MGGVSSRSWTEDPPGRVSVTAGLALKARLFGLPFLAIGCWFAWQILNAAWQVARAEGALGLLKSVPGLLVFAAVGSMFAVPGLLIVAFRKRVTIDTVAGTVEELKDFLVYRRVRRWPASDFCGVTAKYEKTDHSSTSEEEGYTSESWVVTLDRPEGEGVLVDSFEAPRGAVEAAQTLGRLLGVPVEDRTQRRRRKAS